MMNKNHIYIYILINLFIGFKSTAISIKLLRVKKANIKNIEKK